MRHQVLRRGHNWRPPNRPCICCWMQTPLLFVFLFVMFLYLPYLLSDSDSSLFRMISVRVGPSGFDSSGVVVGRLMLDQLNFTYVHNEPNVCANVSVVVYIFSSPGNFAGRQVLRQTWASDDEIRQLGACRVFLLGSTLNETVQTGVNEESEKYHDVVQESFIDSYRNLTLKNVMGLRWVMQYAPRAQYVVKSDDDILLCLELLRKFLDRNHPKKTVFGDLFVDGTPHMDRHSKWYAPEYRLTFGRSRYPHFVSGTCYIMTADSVPELYRTSRLVPFFWLEDVYLGLCAEKAGIRMLKQSQMLSILPSKILHDRCRFRSLISAHVSEWKLIRKIWDEWQTPACRKRTPYLMRLNLSLSRH